MFLTFSVYTLFFSPPNVVFHNDLIFFLSIIIIQEMVSPTRIDKSKGQQEDGGASSKRKRLQEAQEVCILDTQWIVFDLISVSVYQNLFCCVGRPLYQRKTKCLMKTLLAQESKFGGQMTKCKSDDQHVFLISNGVLTVVYIYYFLHQCFFLSVAMSWIFL